MHSEKQFYKYSAVPGTPFKVSVPKSYNNVKEAKLVQKGCNVWVQLPANLVADKRMSRKSVYMDDFNVRSFDKYHNVKPKVVSRRASCPNLCKNYSCPRKMLYACSKAGVSADLTHLKHNQKFGQPGNSFYEGMARGKYYDNAKHTRRHSEPFTMFLPVMESGCDGPRCAPRFETARSMTTVRSYNDKARKALPGLGGNEWDTSYNNNTINGGRLLENTLTRPNVVNYEVNRSMRIQTPQRSACDHSDPTTVSHSPSSSKNSSKRHELEIFAKGKPSERKLGEPSLDHLYQPSGYSSGLKVVTPAYEHGNSTFHHTRRSACKGFIHCRS